MIAKSTDDGVYVADSRHESPESSARWDSPLDFFVLACSQCALRRGTGLFPLPPMSLRRPEDLLMEAQGKVCFEHEIHESPRKLSPLLRFEPIELYFRPMLGAFDAFLQIPASVCTYHLCRFLPFRIGAPLRKHVCTSADI
jgi:hypothetical protein